MAGKKKAVKKAAVKSTENPIAGLDPANLRRRWLANKAEEMGVYPKPVKGIAQVPLTKDELIELFNNL